MNKPIVIFTNFWDAEKALRSEYLVDYDDITMRKIVFRQDPKNHTVCSIALAHPNLDKLKSIKKGNKNEYALPRLDFFCPTYEMLMDYKNGGEWSDYTLKYRSILRERKEVIIEWLDTLEDGHIYLLCCWENTSKKSNCHRKLIYDAFKSSKSLMDKALYIHRDGSWNDTCQLPLG